MFDIGWSELVVIGVVALIVIGPKELPGVLRAMGHYMGKVRRMASEFQDQFREAMREAEVADLKRQFDEASQKANTAFNNPLEIAQKEVEKAFTADAPSTDGPSADAPPPDMPADSAPSALATDDPGAIAPAQTPDAPQAAEPAATAPLDIKPGGGA
jgi:sec-independent protein translocase protein TatB